MQRESAKDASGTPVQSRPKLTPREWLFLWLVKSWSVITTFTDLHIKADKDRLDDLFPQYSELPP
jgi:hypothetical protein